MRALRIACLALLTLACKDRGDRVVSVQDTLTFTSSSGEVALTDGEPLRYSISSERYRAWYMAQQGLDSRIANRYGAILQPASPSYRNIDAAVAYLESEPRAVAAIEGAGMSVRDFVHATIALEQEMNLAKGTRSDVPPPIPLDSAVKPDTFVPIPLPTPVTPPPPYPVFVDTLPRRTDTVYLPRPDSMAAAAAARHDSLMRRKDSIVNSLIRRDTFTTRRDSLPPRRDTIRRDTTRRDTIRRDTIRRDTIRRDTIRRDTIP